MATDIPSDANTEISSVDDIFALLNSENSTQLSPIDRAENYFLLARFGFSDKEIASKIDRSKAHVKQHIDLFHLPAELKAFVTTGHIKWSLAVEVFNRFGTAASPLITDQIQKKLNAGQVAYVTRTDIDRNHGYRVRFTGSLIRRTTDQINLLADLLDKAGKEGDLVVLKLNSAQVAAFKELHRDINPKT